MKLVRKVFPTVTQRAAENLGIFIFALVLHTYAIGSVPPTRHIFEWWVEGIFPVLDKSWHEISLEFVRFHHNDSNANVNSPPWILLVALTRKLFDNPLLGYRIPSTFFSAVAPVLLAEIVRRFYRRDMALFAGLLLATTQNLMHFGRIGGYIAPTTTLLLGLMLCTMSIVWEGKRRAWIPLTLCLFLVPFMYSTVRYMALMVPGLLAWSFLTSRHVRRTQLVPMLVSCVVLFAALFPFTHGNVVGAALNFFSARGDQHLFNDRVLLGEGVQDDPGFVSRVYTVLAEKVPPKLNLLIPHYTDGQRFFDWHYQAYQHSFHAWLALLFAVGMVRALIQSYWQPRYLVMVVWSVWTWVPLLVTTGITVNRMLNGLPADIFLVTFGGMIGVDLLKPILSARFRWVLYALTGLAVVYAMSFSAWWYFHDLYLHGMR